MPKSERLNSLRQAAMTLLAAAPAGAVLMAMRALLDGWNWTNHRASGQRYRPPPAPRRATQAAKVQATRSGAEGR